jgi:hemolysin activation/secretion protein
VRINKDSFAPVSNSRTLTGAGIGLNVFARDGLQLRASYAWALSDAKATGDGDRSAQGWIQFIKGF